MKTEAPFTQHISRTIPSGGDGGGTGGGVGAGIHGIEVYFPKTAVKQEDLEAHDLVAPGKFTVGLGQQSQAFVTDCEDINSIMLTAAASLLEKYDIDASQIGRLEVGTETLIDKSKSVKTTIMDLLAEKGNHDVEGIDCINACYGGTQALLNAVAWTESSAYDGRYALVLCGDIAVYEKGPARPTGGCAAVALLVGPDAPLQLSPHFRASHSENAYDFFKPNLDCEYPVVFGQESNVCYLRSLDSCYRRYAEKYERERGEAFHLGSLDHVILHSPYNKLVKKSGARLLYNDFRRYPALPEFALDDAKNSDLDADTLAAHRSVLARLRASPPQNSEEEEATYSDRELEKTFVSMARPLYDSMVAPGTLLPRELGNSYTAACYTGLASLVHAFYAAGGEAGEEDRMRQAENVIGKNILMFSYGSGLMSTMFGMKVTDDLSHIARAGDLENRLQQRSFWSAEDYTKALDRRKETYNQKDWKPQGNPEELLFPGTYYLSEVDEFGRRKYGRTPRDGASDGLGVANAGAMSHVSGKGGAVRAARAFSTVARRIRI